MSFFHFLILVKFAIFAHGFYIKNSLFINNQQKAIFARVKRNVYNLHTTTSLSRMCMTMDTQPERDDSLYDGISEEDWTLMTELALGDDHVAQLNAKVEAAMQEEWDLTAGVMSGRQKAAPLKMNIDMWSFNAKKEMQKGNFTGAEFWYDKCSKYNPRDGRAWLGLARILWKRGDKVGAERTYKEGLYFDQKNPYLMQGFAVLLEKTGRIEAATTLLTKSVRVQPKHAASWVTLAKLHQRAGRIDEAQFCFSSAVENDPSSYVAYQAWGVLESEKGNIDRARELFRTAISISRECAHAYQVR